MLSIDISEAKLKLRIWSATSSVQTTKHDLGSVLTGSVIEIKVDDEDIPARSEESLGQRSSTISTAMWQNAGDCIETSVMEHPL